jgi:hypothetical protein
LGISILIDNVSVYGSCAGGTDRSSIQPHTV